LPSRGRPVKFAEITAATEADTLEQLGNDYAQLAYRAYSRTRQIDPAAKGISLKLSLLEKVIGDRPAEAARPVAEKKRALVFSDDGPAAPQTLASVSENFAVRESSQRTPSAQPIQAKPSATPTASAVKPESGARNKLDDPLTVVNEWANAWSARDVARYLSFYAPSFKTPMGQSADAWKKSRATRISEKSHIKVTVESPRLTVDGDIANVKFRQIYVSDRVREASGKILVLTRRGDTWQILEERAGS
jgi:ketosteroid isomerase-like protein